MRGLGLGLGRLDWTGVRGLGLGLGRLDWTGVRGFCTFLCRRCKSTMKPPEFHVLWRRGTLRQRFSFSIVKLDNVL